MKPNFPADEVTPAKLPDRLTLPEFVVSEPGGVPFADAGVARGLEAGVVVVPAVLERPPGARSLRNRPPAVQAGPGGQG